MRYTLVVAGVAAGLGIGIGLLIGRQIGVNPPAPPPGDVVDTRKLTSPPMPSGEAKKVAPIPELAPAPRVSGSAVARIAKRVEIKLDTVYATTIQPGLRRFPAGYDDHSRQALRELRTQVVGFGVPDAFLVTAEDVHSAMFLTSAVLTGGRPGDKVWLDPVNDQTPEDLRKIAWLVVKLETVSTPWYWDLVRVELDDRQIFVTYRVSISRKPPLTATYSASFEHAYWIPLPQVGEGKYTIKLREEASSEDTFVRRVQVLTQRTP